MSSPRPFLRGLIAAILILAALAIIVYYLRPHLHWGHPQGMPHAHHHGAAATLSGPATLTLDHGRPWATDEPLRTGMQHIRDAVAAAAASRQQGGLAPAQAAALTTAVQDNVNYMFQHCQLAPEADAALHVLLTELLQGAAQVHANPASAEGFVQLTHALDEYPRYFDHPGWAPLPDAGP